MPQARQSNALRSMRVLLRPGVYVRQDSDGSNLCKVPRCKSAPATLEPRERGLCAKHYISYADGRPLCKLCKLKYSIDPWCDQLCEHCSGETRETTPYEAQVLEEIRRGALPTVAIQTAAPTAIDAARARQDLKRMSRSALTRKRIKRALAASGITDEFLFGQLKKNVEATKVIFNADGERVDEVPDVRGSNQAIDLVLKVSGMYPGKERPEPQRAQQTNVAVAMLPSVEPRRPDAPIYTLPESRRSLGDHGRGGDDE